ncbi:MAG: glycosyltransferase family 4 protein [Cyanobacteria bacterium P01_D01_bin.56]
MKRLTLATQVPETSTSMKRTEPIRVMHVIDKLSVAGSGVHGITKAIEWWVPRFNKKEFQFTVCSLRTPEPAGELLNRKGIPTVFLDKGKFSPGTLTALMRLMKYEQPHVLHLHGYGATNFGRLASWLTGVPNIVHEHAVLPKPPLYQSVADTLLSPLTTKALAVSTQVYDFMHAVRKERRNKLETLIIGIPLDEFQAPPQQQVQATRSQLNIAPAEPVICTIGRLDAQKGQTHLLRAAPKILQTFPKARFLIVGDGPDLRKLQSLVKTEGITERVTFTGLRRDIPALLSLSDVVAIPSIFEGGPLTLLEAMNLAKPIVGTPVGFMPDLIEDGKSGFLVPCRNASQLAEKIIFLLQHPQVAKTMGQQAQDICQNYDISRSQQRLGEIYRDLAGLLSKR